jgi:hypothetical protein
MTSSNEIENTKLDVEDPISIKPPINWSGIATKIGIVASVIAVLGFIATQIAFLFSLQKDTRDFLEMQTEKTFELLEKQAQFEKRIEAQLNQSTTPAPNEKQLNEVIQKE